MMIGNKYALLMQLANNKQIMYSKNIYKMQTQLLGVRTQLDQLQAFRAEYSDRLSGQAQKGIQTVQYQNFRQFLARLDEVIAIQKDEMKRSIERFTLAREAWQAEYRKYKAFEKLLQREQAITLLKAMRQEQKQTDEFVVQNSIGKVLQAS